MILLSATLLGKRRAELLRACLGSRRAAGTETGAGQTYPALYDTITAYYKMPTHTANYNGGNYVTDSITSGNISAKNNTLHSWIPTSPPLWFPATGGKLLILKDSYANRFSQFVINDYTETHLIDLCFYKDSVTNCVEKNGITQVLAPYNIPVLHRIWPSSKQ